MIQEPGRALPGLEAPEDLVGGLRGVARQSRGIWLQPPLVELACTRAVVEAGEQF